MGDFMAPQCTELLNRQSLAVREYTSPRLTLYGAMRELTASGSSNESESASGMVAMCGSAFMFNDMGC